MVIALNMLESTHTKALWMVRKKEKLLTINFIFNFKLMFKGQICYPEIVTFHSKCSKVPPSTTLQTMWEDRVLFVWAVLHVSSCRQENPKCNRTIRLVHPLFFLKTSLFIQPQKHKFKGARLGDSNRSILITIRTRHMHIWNFYLTNTCPIWPFPLNHLAHIRICALTFPSKSPCMYTYMCFDLSP